MRPTQAPDATHLAPTACASLAPGVELLWSDDTFTVTDRAQNTVSPACDDDLLVAADDVEWERICRLHGTTPGQLVKLHGPLGGTVTAWRRADRLTARGPRWSWTAIVRNRYGSTTLASPEPGEELGEWLSAVAGHDVLMRASVRPLPI